MVSVLIPAGASWPDEVTAWADSWKQTATEVVYGWPSPVFDSADLRALPGRIHEAMMRFAVPDDPDASDYMAAKMKQAAFDIGDHADSGLTGAALTITSWQGDSADNFRDYLTVMRDSITQITKLLNDQESVLRNYHSLIKSMQQDFKAVMDKGASDLEASEMAEEKQDLHIATAIVGIMASSSGAGQASALFSGVVNVYLDWQSAEDKPTVLFSFADAMDQLYENTQKEMARIVHGFSVVHQNISDNLTTLNPPRPGVVTKPSFDPDDFSSRDPGADKIEHQVSHDPLVAQPEPSGPAGSSEQAESHQGLGIP